jgi:hypothetical protein
MTARARSRRQAGAAHGRGRGSAGAAVLLETAAGRARRERTVAAAVRAAWDVLVAGEASGRALTAWQRSQGHDGPVEGLFPAACLTAGSPAGVAASLFRAAAADSGRAEGAVA